MADGYGLIFDVDGVIADTEAVNARVSIRVFADLLGVEGVRREDFEAGLGRGAAEYVKAAARVHGVEMTDEQVAEATRMRQEYFLRVLREEPLAAFAGVMELMGAAMEADDFSVAIATSSTLEKSRAVLEATGVPYGRMVYVNGNDVTRKKPDPELFLIAMDRIAVAPRRCVVIEDAPNGVEAGKAAGAKVVAVTNSASAEKLGAADWICDSLEQVSLEGVRELIEGVG